MERIKHPVDQHLPGSTLQALKRILEKAESTPVHVGTEPRTVDGYRERHGLAGSIDPDLPEVA